MTENYRKFKEAAKSNPELQEKLKALGEEARLDQFIAVAAEYGITLNEEDFKPAEDGEISKDDLADVAGGGFLDVLFDSKLTCAKCKQKISGGAAGMAYHLLKEHT